MVISNTKQQSKLNIVVSKMFKKYIKHTRIELKTPREFNFTDSLNIFFLLLKPFLDKVKRSYICKFTFQVKLLRKSMTIF